MQNVRIYVFSIIVLLCAEPLFAQFIYQESCLGTTGIFAPKGDAYYTASHGIDNNGSGWLRLTEDINNSSGYVLADGSYSSTSGLTVEFDFVVWSTHSKTPADGFCVFLFDGSVTNEQFHIGAIGGGLGYLPSGGSGLSKGYIGVGIDEFGNYTNYEQGVGAHPNAITVRGPYNQGSGYSNLGSTFTNFGSANDPALINTQIAFFSPTRPTDYRRVKIELTPSGTGMMVDVYMKTSTGGSYMHAIGPIFVSTPAPATLRVGFSAVTGGSTAVHEVRNVLIRATGDLLVHKFFDDCINEEGATVTINSSIYNATQNNGANLEVYDTLPANFVVSNVTIDNGGWASGIPLHSGIMQPDGRTAFHYFVNVASETITKITWYGSFTSLSITDTILSSLYVVPPPWDVVSTDNYISREGVFTPPPIVTDTTVCHLAPLTISVAPLKYHTIKWYDANMTAISGPPKPTAAGQHVYYVSYYNADLKCEGKRARLEINITPLPEFDFDIAMKGACIESYNPQLVLTGLNTNSIYEIYSNKQMDSLINSITNVNGYVQNIDPVADSCYIRIINNSCASKDIKEIKFEPIAVNLTPETVPSAIENTNYLVQLETNGVQPTFSIVSGHLPNGISMDSNGKIEGKANIGEAGNFTFTVEVVDENTCRISNVYGFYLDVFVPKAFSPNGDGINDIFMQGFKVKILDRLGITIFEGNDGWNGEYKGKPAPVDIYFYTLFLSDKSIKTGYIGIIR